MNEEKAYLRQGKWNSDKVYKILTNSIYIGTFAYGKTKRKAQDILYVDNYCESIIDKNTWDITRKRLEKNKHPNYGEHVHLFTGIVKCPTCGKIMSSTNSFKNSGKPNQKVYYHVTCKKFTEEFISKSSKDYIEYLYQILQKNNIRILA